jgi:alanyl-tRNA synthetase
MTVIELYGETYPELVRHQETILETITREEDQFQKTLEKATHHLESLFEFLHLDGKTIISGEQAADIYTTYGMPMEITRDIAQERGFSVYETGFTEAMEAHRRASGAGKAMGELGGEDVSVYRKLRQDLLEEGLLPSEGVSLNPYLKPSELSLDSRIIAILKNSNPVENADPGDEIEVVLPETIFYIESGGQVSDTGMIMGKKELSEGKPSFIIHVTGTRKPAAGVITHLGKVLRGNPRVGESVIVKVDSQKRMDIMRNHTATHLLHAALRSILGNHARQAGSLVAANRLRFDFTHPEALTFSEIKEIEAYVNEKILSNYHLDITYKPLEDALETGAIALFGEKYSDQVRNITIGDMTPFSNELCGGTHVESTADIGIFLITSESSVAAGVRRIEAITGRKAYELVQQRFQKLEKVSSLLGIQPQEVVGSTQNLIDELKTVKRQLAELQVRQTTDQFLIQLEGTHRVNDINVLTVKLKDVDIDSLRKLSDIYRKRYPKNGIIVLTSVIENRPIIIAAVTENLVSLGIKAGDLAGFVAKQLGGGGGGKPTLAQAGGKDVKKIDEALNSVLGWVQKKSNKQS